MQRMGPYRNGDRDGEFAELTEPAEHRDSEPAKLTDTELEPSRHRDEGPTRSYQTGGCPKIRWL